MKQNEPKEIPSWFLLLCIASLSALFTTFIQVNVYKSIGLVPQLAEIRGIAHSADDRIDALETRIAVLEIAPNPESSVISKKRTFLKWTKK